MTCGNCGKYAFRLERELCFDCQPGSIESPAPEVPVTSASLAFPADAVPSSSSLSLYQGGENKDEERDELRYVDALLADVAAGAFDPLPVALPNVPADVPPMVRRVVEDFESVAGARLAVGDSRPVPYACRWAAARLGVGHMAVNRALRYLVDIGALQDGGAMPGRGGRGTKLYLPAAAVRHLRQVA